MDIVASFIESVSTTKNHEERCRAYQYFQQKVKQLEGTQDEETPSEKSMLALARVMNGDAESRIAHLQKACVGMLEMLLVTDILSEDARTVFIDNLLREPSGNRAHQLAFKVFQDRVSREIEANILNPNVIFGTRHSLYKTAIEAISADLPKETSAQFLVTKILPAMYQRFMEDQLRESTIELAMHFDVGLVHLSASDQEAFSNTVMTKYCPVITDLMEADYENWHKLWIFTIKFYGVKFHSMMVLANRLLRVIEEAFRRKTVPKILKGYECWLAAIENASLDKKHLCSSKQIKLLLTPLKARLSKEPAVLLKRFDTFVRFMTTLQDMAMLCLHDFLVVCYGPFDDGVGRPQVNKRIPEMCQRSTVALFDILGHGHCNDENCVKDSFIQFKEPLMIPANFAKCYAVLIDSVLECCIVLPSWILPSWNSSALDAAVVVKCLWLSLLQLCNASDNDTKSECWTKLTTKLRALSEKIADNEFCSTILGGFVEASAMLEIAALNEIMFEISMNLLCRTSEPINFNADKIESLIGALLESDNARCSKIALGYFDRDTNPVKMSVLCEVWLKCPRSDATSLLWPIRHLKHFKDLKVFETVWTERYAKYSGESEPIKMGFLQKLEGLFAENPLLSPGIILVLHSMSSCDSIATSDFVTKSMRLLGSVLTYPNLSDDDIKTSIAVVILHLIFIGLPLQEGSDDAINKLCTAVQHLITVHKNLTILPMLEDFLKDQPRTCLVKFSRHLVPFLETVLLDDDSSANVCGKLLELLDVKDAAAATEPPRTPNLTSRSLRMLNMANKSPSDAPGGLRLFAKTKETPPAKMSSPSTRSKLIMQNTPPRPLPPPTAPPARHKINVSIDEEKSSDFVKIDTPVRFEPKKLSERQKEVMLKRREDIPALYQDLSQSQDWSQDSSKSATSVPPPPPAATVGTIKTCSNNNNEAMKVSSFKKPRIGKKQRTVKTDLDSSLDSSMDENSGGSGKVSPSVASETTNDTLADVVVAPINVEQTATSEVGVDETAIEDVPRPSSRTRRRSSLAETPTQVRKSLRQQARKSKQGGGAENTPTTGAESSRVATPVQKPEEETPKKTVEKSESEPKTAEQIQESKEWRDFIEEKLPEHSSTAAIANREETHDTLEHVKDEAEIEFIRHILDTGAKIGEKRKRESSSPPPEQSKKRRSLLRKHVDSPIATKAVPKTAEKRKVKLKKIEEFWPGIRKNEIPEPETTVKQEEEVAEAEGDAIARIEQSVNADENRSEFLELLELKANSQEVAEAEANEAAKGPAKKIDRRKRSKHPFCVPTRKTSKRLYTRAKKRTAVGHVTADSVPEGAASKVASKISPATSPPSPKVAASPPKVASCSNEDEEYARSVLVERLLVAEETMLKMQQNRLKYALMKPCHVQLGTTLSPQSVPTSPVKPPEMRRRARSMDDLVPVNETKRTLRPRSFPEDASNKQAAMPLPLLATAATAESTLGSQDIIESSQTDVVEIPPQSSSPPPPSSVQPDIATTPPPSMTVSPSDSLADTESCASMVKSLSPKDTTVPQALLTSSERLMADMSTETLHSETLTLQNTDDGSSNTEELPGSPAGCVELVREFLQSTSDIPPICSLEEGKKDEPSPVAAATTATTTTRPQSLLPVSTRGTRLLQMVNPESVRKVVDQPKRKEPQHEILTFSREIPSPLSLPGNSILKRRRHHSDDIGSNPPKRKRVNFSDPAITKEKIYLTDFPDEDGLEEDITTIPNSDFDKWFLLKHGKERKEFSESPKKSGVDLVKYFCDKKLGDDDCAATMIKMTGQLNVSNVKQLVVEFMGVANHAEQQNTPADLASETDKQAFLEAQLVPLLNNKLDLETYVDVFVVFLKKLPLNELQGLIGRLRVVLGREFEQHYRHGREPTVINKGSAKVRELLDSVKKTVENLTGDDDRREFFIGLMKFTAENCVADDENVAFQMKCVLDLQRRKMEHR